MIRCVIVDDEPLAREVLELYVSQNADLQLVATCKNAKEVQNLLVTEQVDVLFLDIQMPDLSGMDLVRLLENPPMIVFTTAYDQYAVEGFEVNAVDYLLKPIAPERFNIAVDKVKKHKELTTPISLDAEGYMFIRADYQDVKVAFSEILYVEGLKDYVKVVMLNRKIITLTNIKGMMERLPQDKFARIHKSYIVAMDKVDSVKGRVAIVAGKQLPIGLTFKDNFKKRLKLID